MATKSTKQKTALPPLDVLQRHTVEEAAAYLRTSRVTIFKLIASGDLKSLKEGKRRFIPGTEIARLSSVDPTPASSPAVRTAASRALTLMQGGK